MWNKIKTYNELSEEERTKQLEKNTAIPKINTSATEHTSKQTKNAEIQNTNLQEQNHINENQTKPPPANQTKISDTPSR